MKEKIKYRNVEEHGESVQYDAASGSRFWEVGGKNLQFTWFDVPAGTHFEEHSHESEQVTYVLEGELFFESGINSYKLTKGDCILIPGKVNHRVWTGNIPARAVDAWSPVNKTYSTQKIKK